MHILTIYKLSLKQVSELKNGKHPRKIQTHTAPDI